MKQLEYEGVTSNLEAKAILRVAAQDHVDRVEKGLHIDSYNESSLTVLEKCCLALGLSTEGTKAELAEYD